jgi:transcriptional regulator with GAF, ATPase, and Fis domain
MAPELAIPLKPRPIDPPPVLRYVDLESTIVGTSEVLKDVMYRVGQVAPTNASVLLLRETGTGKELIAQVIHQRSPRRKRSFVASTAARFRRLSSKVSCSDAIAGLSPAPSPRSRAASSWRTAAPYFSTKLVSCRWRFNRKLLRVLQEGQIDRLGSLHPARVDVRVIAATNRNLLEEVQRGRFRKDLFYRLNVFPITMPSLRERREDLQALVHHFCGLIGRRLGRAVGRITPGTMRALERYDWPGNIRELENVLQQAIILSRDGVLDLSGFVGEPLDLASPEREGRALRAFSDVERDHIQHVLKKTAWRIQGIAGAAQILGLRPSTLRTRVRKLGIHRPGLPMVPEQC